MSSVSSDASFHQYKQALICNEQQIRRKYQMEAKYRRTITIHLPDQCHVYNQMSLASLMMIPHTKFVSHPPLFPHYISINYFTQPHTLSVFLAYVYNVTPGCSSLVFTHIFAVILPTFYISNLSFHSCQHRNVKGTEYNSWSEIST
jgi:hypothetical protein